MGVIIFNIYKYTYLDVRERLVIANLDLLTEKHNY